MPWDDHIEDSYDDAELPGMRQPAMSRRTMLRTAAGAGAVGLMGGVALGAAAPAAAGLQPAKRVRSPRPPQRPAGDEQVVVHVRDARSGEMDIFAGTSQTRLVDPDLAARLVRAAG